MLGLLKIRVQRGINLPLKDTFHSDPYVVVTLGEQVYMLFLVIYVPFDMLCIGCEYCCSAIVLQRVKTSCKKNNCNPVWNDELTLALKYPDVPVVLVSIVFHFSLYLKFMQIWLGILWWLLEVYFFLIPFLVLILW